MLPQNLVLYMVGTFSQSVPEMAIEHHWSIHVYTYNIYIYICIWLYMHIICIYKCIYIYIFICIYIYIYSYLHSKLKSAMRKASQFWMESSRRTAWQKSVGMAIGWDASFWVFAMDDAFGESTRIGGYRSHRTQNIIQYLYIYI